MTASRGLTIRCRYCAHRVFRDAEGKGFQALLTHVAIVHCEEHEALQDALGPVDEGGEHE